MPRPSIALIALAALMLGGGLGLAAIALGPGMPAAHAQGNNLRPDTPARETIATAEDCDFSDAPGIGAPTRVFEILCFQAGRRVIYEPCLGRPEVSTQTEQGFIKATQFDDPLFIVPGETAACLVRSMADEPDRPGYDPE